MVFAVLWRLRGRLKPDGSLFLLYLSLYSFGRFFIEFTRAVTLAQVNVGGVLHTPLHFVALIVMAVCIPLLIYRMLRARAVVEPSVLEDP